MPSWTPQRPLHIFDKLGVGQAWPLTITQVAGRGRAARMLGNIDMQTSLRPAGAIALASILAASLLAATPALATKPVHDPKSKDYVFDFNAYCDDCSAEAGQDEYGEGVLTLKGVTNLSDLSNINFVDFTYSSSKTGDLDINTISKFTGDFSNLNAVTVDIEGSFTAPPCAEKGCEKTKGSPLSYIFVTSTTVDDGPNWSLSIAKGNKTPKNADLGAAYSWTAASVPEPVSWALMIAGFGLAGAQVRMQRRNARRAA